MARTSNQEILIENCNLINGMGERTIQDAYVHIEKGRIHEYGPMAALASRHIDPIHKLNVQGKTVMPGLIDCHAHLHYAGLRTSENLEQRSAIDAAIDATRAAKTILMSGFTTVRDLGTIGHVAQSLKSAIQEGRASGPRIIPSGRILMTSRSPMLGQTSTTDDGTGFALKADGPEGLADAVEYQQHQGAENIKIMASGVEVHPAMDTKTTLITQEEMMAASNRAHDLGMTVAVHCQSYDAARFAALAGVDSIEHGTRLDDETIDLMVKNDVSLVPTLSTPYSIIELGETLELNAKQRHEAAENLPLWLESLQRAVAAGVRIGSGADIGNRYAQGQNALEIMHLSQNGLTASESIAAATGNAAYILGIADETGDIQVGMAADLLVVDGDPINDIRVLTDPSKIEIVMRNGIVEKQSRGNQ